MKYQDDGVSFKLKWSHNRRSTDEDWSSLSKFKFEIVEFFIGDLEQLFAPKGLEDLFSVFDLKCVPDCRPYIHSSHIHMIVIVTRSQHKQQCLLSNFCDVRVFLAT